MSRVRAFSARLRPRRRSTPRSPGRGGGGAVGSDHGGARCGRPNPRAASASSFRHGRCCRGPRRLRRLAEALPSSDLDPIAFNARVADSAPTPSPFREDAGGVAKPRLPRPPRLRRGRRARHRLGAVRRLVEALPSSELPGTVVSACVAGTDPARNDGAWRCWRRRGSAASCPATAATARVLMMVGAAGHRRNGGSHVQPIVADQQYG